MLIFFEIWSVLFGLMLTGFVIGWLAETIAYMKSFASPHE